MMTRPMGEREGWRRGRGLRGGMGKGEGARGKGEGGNEEEKRGHKLGANVG